MAKGKKTGGKDFVKGHTVSKPRLPAELKGLASLTKAEATKALSDALKLRRDELDLLLADPEAAMLDLCAAKIVKAAYDQGDAQRLNFMFDRLIGKVVDKVEHKSIEPFIIIRPSGEQVLLGAKIKGESEE